jgi:hypothetical protein
MLTVFKYPPETVIYINETAVENLRAFCEMLKPNAISPLSTLVKSTLSPILVIDWDYLRGGTDLDVLPALPPSVKSLEILFLPVIFRSKIACDSFCHKLSNNTLKKLTLTSCGFRASELAALEQLPDLTVIVRHGQVTDH